MSNVSYDLDTSGGLMPLIRALIKPPDEDLNAQKPKKPQHPYYKRPGKGHNHDSCDACGEGGDLICCDRCPASFHLGCYDPPLEERDIPTGQWLCRECRGKDAEKPTSTRSSRAQSPVDVAPFEETEKKTRSQRNNSNTSQQTSENRKEEIRDLDRLQGNIDEIINDDAKSALDVLVKAARILNPRQFELPREIGVPFGFPGTEKG
ncbi:PHD finger protein 12 [Eumeta japonica]|uniref:PHD finger protein 12 n=1 Tax=Eumeta variegata TaxID=151549 RepID=A0A4C1X8G8_EUMVA|nr:PHD finger protein 12 [Eumeta japonica]